MIIKRNFNPIRIIQYVKVELLIATAVAIGTFLLHNLKLVPVLLPFSVAAILGSALAIFIAFRNNSSYTRWWEARTLWGNILNNSRIFARQIIANADQAVAAGKASKEAVYAYKKEMIYRQIAFAHALRLHLRRQSDALTLKPLLSDAESNELAVAMNKPNLILMKQGVRIKEGMKSEMLGAFDNISLEPTLAGLNNFQGACERIKNTPMLRQYDFFTRLFLYVFIIILPFSLIGDFIKMNWSYLTVPVSVLISYVFSTMSKVGEVNEDPFENRITDVPMTAICNAVERDLKEMLGEKNLPDLAKPENGFLF